MYRCREGVCKPYFECIGAEGTCVESCPLGCCCVGGADESLSECPPDTTCVSTYECAGECVSPCSLGCCCRTV